MSQSSVYQQLHGHLAALRLSAAAEALPGGASRRRRDNWHATPTLDRSLVLFHGPRPYFVGDGGKLRPE